jgi:hypothetical protein
MKTSVLVWVVLALAACGKNEHAFARFLEDAQPAPRDAPPPPVDAAMPSLAQIVADAKATKPTPVPAPTPKPKPAPKKGGSCRHHDISVAGCDCTGIERIQPGRNNYKYSDYGWGPGETHKVVYECQGDPCVGPDSETEQPSYPWNSFNTCLDGTAH